MNPYDPPTREPLPSKGNPIVGIVLTIAIACLGAGAIVVAFERVWMAWKSAGTTLILTEDYPPAIQVDSEEFVD